MISHHLLISNNGAHRLDSNRIGNQNRRFFDVTRFPRVYIKRTFLFYYETYLDGRLSVQGLIYDKI